MQYKFELVFAPGQGKNGAYQATRYTASFIFRKVEARSKWVESPSVALTQVTKGIKN